MINKFLLLLSFTVVLFSQDYYHKGNLEKLKDDCIDRNTTKQSEVNEIFYSYLKSYYTPSFEVMKVFIKDCDVDVNYAPKDSSSSMPPLFEAIDKGNFKLVKLLVEFGANIDLDTPWRSPVRFAIFKEHKDSRKIFSYLLKNGANPNYKDASGYSMIYTLARAGFKNSKPKYYKKEDNRKEELFYAKELLKYNVIITKEDIEWAKKNGKIELYKLLKGNIKK